MVNKRADTPYIPHHTIPMLLPGVPLLKEMWQYECYMLLKTELMYPDCFVLSLVIFTALLYCPIYSLSSFGGIGYSVFV